MIPPLSAAAAEAGGEILPEIARAAILEKLSAKPAAKKKAAKSPAPKKKAAAVPAPTVTGYLAQRRGVFVTLRDAQGESRGCFGTVEASQANLIEETRHSAIDAATEDSRFPPVKDAKELKNLSIEVCVLGTPERVESIIELDPEIYGVILTATKTGVRGVMLPNEPGLGTVDKQLAAIRRKAGLRPDERLKIERFRVEKFTES